MKIAIITASRAEWGILRPLCKELTTSLHQISLIITGSHLHSQSSFSMREIEDDIDIAQVTIEKVYITPETPDAPNQTLMFDTISNCFNRLSRCLVRIEPDLVIYIGDRYEIFAAATVCRLLGIKSAHISGGEITLGAFDDSLRHCITKLSDLHFTATNEYRSRVIQLGENTERVFNVGELALADFDKYTLLGQKELENALGIQLNSFFLLTMHPETSSPNKVSGFIDELIDMLLCDYPSTKLIFTGANADPEGELINRKIEERIAKEPELLRFYTSLGRLRYLSAASLAKAVIGNSSSGIIEIPALFTPVINIGDRERGRPHGEGVISVPFDKTEILQALKKVCNLSFREKCKSFASLYSGIDSARAISRIISNLDVNKISSKKQFYDII